MAKALLIGVDGSITEIEANGLADYQTAVGGFIEGIELADGGSWAYVDEEANIQESPPASNVVASHFLIVAQRKDFIRRTVLGPVVVVGPDKPNGDHSDVTWEYRMKLNVLAEACAALPKLGDRRHEPGTN